MNRDYGFHPFSSDGTADNLGYGVVLSLLDTLLPTVHPHDGYGFIFHHEYYGISHENLLNLHEYYFFFLFSPPVIEPVLDLSIVQIHEPSENECISSENHRNPISLLLVRK